MKSLDQAFIKAYRSRVASRQPAEERSPTAASAVPAPHFEMPQAAVPPSPESAAAAAAAAVAGIPATAVMPKVDVPTVEAMSLAVEPLTTVVDTTTPSEPAWAIAPAASERIYVTDTTSPQPPCGTWDEAASPAGLAVLATAEPVAARASRPNSRTGRRD